MKQRDEYSVSFHNSKPTSIADCLLHNDGDALNQPLPFHRLS